MKIYIALIFVVSCWAQTPSSGSIILDPFTGARNNDMISPDLATLWRPGEPTQVGDALECVSVTSNTGGHLVYAAPNSGTTCSGQWVDGTNGYGMANLLFFPRGDAGAGAPAGWAWAAPCVRPGCQYAMSYATTNPLGNGASSWNGVNRLYFTITSDTTHGVTPAGHTIDGTGSMELGFYTRSQDNTATGNQGAHYYGYYATGIYAGFPLSVVANRKFQHNNEGDGTDQYPEDPEWFQCCYGQGQVSPIHFWQGETTMYTTAGPNAGGWTGNFTFSPFTLGTNVYQENDDYVSSMTGTYNGSTYEITLAQPKIVPGGVNYDIWYSSVGSMHVNGLSSGTHLTGAPFRGQDASNYTGFWAKLPNMAQVTNMWVAVRPSGIPITGVTGTTPITVKTGTLSSGNGLSFANAPNRHWLQTGDTVTVANLCANANGPRTVTVVDNYSVSLGVSGTCTYAGYTGTGSATMTATSDIQNFSEILIGPGGNVVPGPSATIRAVTLVGGATAK